MRRGPTGYYIALSSAPEKVTAFVPKDLPPDPPLKLEGKLQDLLTNAMFALGQLDGLTTVLPQPDIFLYSYVRKEAVLSSQIEGTQSSLSDLLLFEIEGTASVPIDDVKEVSNYVAALTHGVDRIKTGFPVSLRLFREIHGILLAKGRGSQKEPGEFRRSQNWIGGTRPGNAVFVPPPADHIIDCMGSLENFLHGRPVTMQPLVKAALAHVQFETIHPFLDGNGRLGRLLITLLLCAEGILSEPLLYLSLYFKQHRDEYYDLLQRVRVDGDWESWLEFFFKGVHTTAQAAAQTAKQMIGISAADEERLRAEGERARSALVVQRFLQRRPLTTIANASRSLHLSIPTTTRALAFLERLKIVREVTGQKRKRSYAYDAYLRILSQGDEPTVTPSG